LNVPADQAWTNTGVVLEPGMIVEIRAVGMVDAAPVETMRPYFLAVPPEGRDQRVSQVPQPDLPGLCLLGKVAEDVFYVGKQLRLEVEPAHSGALYLGINDDIVDDNHGAWEVWIKVTRRSAP
jgi:hypothetical protein